MKVNYIKTLSSEGSNNLNKFCRKVRVKLLAIVTLILLSIIGSVFAEKKKAKRGRVKFSWKVSQTVRDGSYAMDAGPENPYFHQLSKSNTRNKNVRKYLESYATCVSPDKQGTTKMLDCLRTFREGVLREEYQTVSRIGTYVHNTIRPYLCEGEDLKELEKHHTYVGKKTGKTFKSPNYQMMYAKCEVFGMRKMLYKDLPRLHKLKSPHPLLDFYEDYCIEYKGYKTKAKLKYCQRKVKKALKEDLAIGLKNLEKMFVLEVMHSMVRMRRRDASGENEKEYEKLPYEFKEKLNSSAKEKKLGQKIARRRRQLATDKAYGGKLSEGYQRKHHVQRISLAKKKVEKNTKNPKKLVNQCLENAKKQGWIDKNGNHKIETFEYRGRVVEKTRYQICLEEMARVHDKKFEACKGDKKEACIATLDEKPENMKDRENRKMMQFAQRYVDEGEETMLEDETCFKTLKGGMKGRLQKVYDRQLRSIKKVEELWGDLKKPQAIAECARMKCRINSPQILKSFLNLIDAKAKKGSKKGSCLLLVAEILPYLEKLGHHIKLSQKESTRQPAGDGKPKKKKSKRDGGELLVEVRDPTFVPQDKDANPYRCPSFLDKHNVLCLGSGLYGDLLTQSSGGFTQHLACKRQMNDLKKKLNKIKSNSRGVVFRKTKLDKVLHKKMVDMVDYWKRRKRPNKDVCENLYMELLPYLEEWGPKFGVDTPKAYRVDGKLSIPQFKTAESYYNALRDKESILKGFVTDTANIMEEDYHADLGVFGIKSMAKNLLMSDIYQNPESLKRWELQKWEKDALSAATRCLPDGQQKSLRRELTKTYKTMNELLKGRDPKELQKKWFDGLNFARKKYQGLKKASKVLNKVAARYNCPMALRGSFNSPLSTANPKFKVSKLSEKKIVASEEDVKTVERLYMKHMKKTNLVTFVEYEGEIKNFKDGVVNCRDALGMFQSMHTAQQSLLSQFPLLSKSVNGKNLKNMSDSQFNLKNVLKAAKKKDNEVVDRLVDICAKATNRFEALRKEGKRLAGLEPVVQDFLSCRDLGIREDIKGEVKKWNETPWRNMCLQRRSYGWAACRSFYQHEHKKQDDKFIDFYVNFGSVILNTASFMIGGGAVSRIIQLGIIGGTDFVIPHWEKNKSVKKYKAANVDFHNKFISFGAYQAAYDQMDSATSNFWAWQAVGVLGALPDTFALVGKFRKAVKYKNMDDMGKMLAAESDLAKLDNFADIHPPASPIDAYLAFKGKKKPWFKTKKGMAKFKASQEGAEMFKDATRKYLQSQYKVPIEMLSDKDMWALAEFEMKLRNIAKVDPHLAAVLRRKARNHLWLAWKDGGEIKIQLARLAEILKEGKVKGFMKVVAKLDELDQLAKTEKVADAGSDATKLKKSKKTPKKSKKEKLGDSMAVSGVDKAKRDVFLDGNIYSKNSDPKPFATKLSGGNKGGAYVINDSDLFRSTYNVNFNGVIKESTGLASRDEALKQVQAYKKASESGEGPKLVDYKIVKDGNQYRVRIIMENVSDISGRPEFVKVVRADQLDSLKDLPIEMRKKIIQEAVAFSPRHPDGHPKNFFVRIKKGENGELDFEIKGIDFDSQMSSMGKMDDILKKAPGCSGKKVWDAPKDCIEFLARFEPNYKDNVPGMFHQYNFYFQRDWFAYRMGMTPEDVAHITPQSLFKGKGAQSTKAVAATDPPKQGFFGKIFGRSPASKKKKFDDGKGELEAVNKEVKQFHKDFPNPNKLSAAGKKAYFKKLKQLEKRQIAAAKKMLKADGVKFTISSEKVTVHGKKIKVKVIKIKAKARKNSHKFNKLAKAVDMNMNNLEFVYVPRILPPGAAAAYSRSKNRIYLPHESMLTPGKFDFYAKHELRHAYVEKQLKGGDLSLYHGEIFMRTPGSATSKLGREFDIYDEGLSLDELLTYGRDDVAGVLKDYRNVSKKAIAKQSELKAAKASGNQNLVENIEKQLQELFAQRKVLEDRLDFVSSFGEKLAGRLSNHLVMFASEVSNGTARIKTPPVKVAGGGLMVTVVKGTAPNEIVLKVPLAPLMTGQKLEDATFLAVMDMVKLADRHKKQFSDTKDLLKKLENTKDVESQLALAKEYAPVLNDGINFKAARVHKGGDKGVGDKFRDKKVSSKDHKYSKTTEKVDTEVKKLDQSRDPASIPPKGYDAVSPIEVKEFKRTASFDDVAEKAKAQGLENLNGWKKLSADIKSKVKSYSFLDWKNTVAEFTGKDPAIFNAAVRWAYKTYDGSMSSLRYRMEMFKVMVARGDKKFFFAFDNAKKTARLKIESLARDALKIDMAAIKGNKQKIKQAHKDIKEWIKKEYGISNPNSLYEKMAIKNLTKDPKYKDIKVDKTSTVPLKDQFQAGLITQEVETTTRVLAGHTKTAKARAPPLNLGTDAAKMNGDELSKMIQQKASEGKVPFAGGEENLTYHAMKHPVKTGLSDDTLDVYQFPIKGGTKNMNPEDYFSEVQSSIQNAKWSTISRNSDGSAIVIYYGEGVEKKGKFYHPRTILKVGKDGDVSVLTYQDNIRKRAIKYDPKPQS